MVAVESEHSAKRGGGGDQEWLCVPCLAAGDPRGRSPEGVVLVGLWFGPKPEQKFAAGIFMKMQRTSAQSQFFFRA